MLRKSRQRMAYRTGSSDWFKLSHFTLLCNEDGRDWMNATGVLRWTHSSALMQTLTLSEHREKLEDAIPVAGFGDQTEWRQSTRAQRRSLKAEFIAWSTRNTACRTKLP